MSDEWAPPAPATAFFSPTKHLDALVVVASVKVEHDVEKFEEVKDVVKAGVWIIQGEGAGAEFEDAEISNVLLFKQLAPLVGKYTLGRIKREGRSAVLAPASDEDKVTASTWMSRGGRAKVDAVLNGSARQKAAPKPKSGSDMPPPPPVSSEPPF